jgi:hypothetical protein
METFNADTSNPDLKQFYTDLMQLIDPNMDANVASFVVTSLTEKFKNLKCK